MSPTDYRSLYELVSFAQPPVAEVALTAQFDPDTVDIEAVGLFAHRVRNDFPVRQRQPVMPPISETFDQLPGTPSINIQFADPSALPRIWLMSKNENDLVQVQHDRLSYNWRRFDDAVEYPRYRRLRRRFTRLLETLAKCVAEADESAEAGRTLTVNLCEVAYVNPIDFGLSGTTGHNHPDLARIINRLKVPRKDAFLPRPEDSQFQARWRISIDGSNGPPIGRLHLSATPALKSPDQTPIYMVNLTARVHPQRPTKAEALKALDLAHRWVVLGFKDVTTEDAQRHWGIDEGE